uniref:Uncharacterized protein n=1 Tax=Anguilla anguilla TaxID=7936 RepID=A0A0E9W4Z5_ANGAN
MKYFQTQNSGTIFNKFTDLCHSIFCQRIQNRMQLFLNIDTIISHFSF